MNQTTQKSQPLSETCETCGAPIYLRTLSFGEEDAMEFREHTCNCRDKEIAKEEEEKKAKERWDVFKRRQKDLDYITNYEFLRGGGITFKELDRTSENNKQITGVESYLENLKENLKEGKSFGLLGKAGRGKTALGMCLHNELINRGITSACVNAPLFFPKLDAMKFKEREETIEKIMNARFLFLDDLFRTDYTQAKRELIYRIIEYRYPLHLPTFFASNIYDKDVMEIRKKMVSSLGGGTVSEAIVDRLFNSRVVLIMFVSGESFRQGGVR